MKTIIKLAIAAMVVAPAISEAGIRDFFKNRFESATPTEAVVTGVRTSGLVSAAFLGKISYDILSKSAARDMRHESQRIYTINFGRLGKGLSIGFAALAVGLPSLLLKMKPKAASELPDWAKNYPTRNQLEA
jgi:hypothetical protein